MDAPRQLTTKGALLFVAFIAAASAVLAFQIVRPRPTPFIDACEAGIKGVIATPSTYKRSNEPNPALRHVLIHFDAANAFGTPVRQWATCRFAEDKSEPDLIEFSWNGHSSKALTGLAALAIIDARRP